VKRVCIVLAVAVALGQDLECTVSAQDAQGPFESPVMRLEAGGPTSYVTSIVFSPDGHALYAAGWDKVVRVWNLDPATGRFHLDPASAYRVPIGPELAGAINALALSPDGRFLAVAGKSVIGRSAGFRGQGVVVPSKVVSSEMRLDEGTIWVFDTRDRSCRPLRGHLGSVLTLSFAPSGPQGAPYLISAGEENDPQSDQTTGGVRLWDVAQARQITSIGLSKPALRPGISVRRRPDQPDQLLVGLAWGDGQFRVWSTGPGTVARSPDGQGANQVAWSASNGEWLTGGVAQLQTWNSTGRLAPGERNIAFSSTQPAHSAWALALFPATPNGPPNRAAVVGVRREGSDQVAYFLDVVNLDAAGARPPQPIPLFTRAAVDSPQPALAVSATGRHLAVSGASGHEIWVYDLPGLLADTSLPPQRLAGAGERFGFSSFAANQDRSGLWLSRRKRSAPGAKLAGPAEGDLVLDFSTGRITREATGWSQPSADAPAWTGRPSALPTGSVRLDLSETGGRSRSIVLPPGQRLTDFTIWTSGTTLRVAVASHLFKQPVLFIYDGQTGRPLRQLFGHSEVIHSVSVSADGRFLVSASDDRTVAVWKLDDLDLPSAVRGQLDGLILIESEGQLMVAAGPAGLEVAERDRLLGEVRDGRLESFTSAYAFYSTMSQRKPGSTVTLRFQRPGGAARDVSIPVQRGPDERKPLFTLFVDAASPAEPPAWIAWNPLGPFESSTESIERLVGWHFNLGQPERPAVFSSTDQYRENFRRGLVLDLLSEGELTAPKPSPPKPAPIMSLRLEGVEESIDPRSGDLFIRSPATSVRLAAFPYASADVTAARLRLGNDPDPLPLTFDVGEGAFVGELPPDVWVRGRLEFQGELVTAEAAPQTFSTAITVRFQPPAPAIEAGLTPSGPVTMQPVARLAGRITPADRAGRARGTVRFSSSDGTSETRMISSEGPFEEEFQLKPGTNSFELTAINAEALAGHESLETAARSFQLVYQPKPEPMPVIVVSEVLPVAGDEWGEGLSVPINLPVVVESPSIVVVGRIVSEGKVAEASLQQGDAPQQQLANTAADPASAFDFKQPIDAAPGRQTVRIKARTAGGATGEAAFELEYHPSPPTAQIIRPTAGEVVIEGEGPTRVELAAKLDLASANVAPQPLVGQFLVNQLPAGPELMIREGATEVTAEADLNLGENLIQLRLTNSWQRQSTTEPLIVRYLSPPRIVQVEAPTVSDTPLVDVIYWVESPKSRSPLAASANGRAVSQSDIRLDGDMWMIVARGIPLSNGENVIRLEASNLDGPCRQPATAAVSYRAKMPPQVSWTSEQETVRESACEVGFQIRSETQLARVELVSTVGGSSRTVYSLEDPSTVPQVDGAYLLTAAPLVDLERGLNQLELLAVNAGGTSRIRRVLSYIPLPVQVVVDRIVPFDAGLQPMQPAAQGDGRLAFAEAPEADLRIEGRVRWQSLADPSLKTPHSIQVWVNGFQQVPVQLDPPDGDPLSRGFQVRTLLNRARQNRLELVVEGLPADSQNRLSWEMDCARPQSNLRLHVLIIGIGVPESERDPFVGRALKSLQIRKNDRGGYEKDGYSGVGLYPSQKPGLCGTVSRQKIIYQLDGIKASIQALSKREGGRASDVVVLYYQGGEILQQDGAVLLATSYAGPAGAFPARELVRFIEASQGAHVLLLDVGRPTSSDSNESQAPAAALGSLSSRAGLLRYSWLKGLQAPPDAQLLTAVGDALDEASRLADVEKRVSAHFKETDQKYPRSLSYEGRLPHGLEELVIGKP
jgi:WD40 repeat protein